MSEIADEYYYIETSLGRIDFLLKMVKLKEQISIEIKANICS